MKSAKDLLYEASGVLLDGITELAAESNLYLWAEPGDGFITARPYAFRELSASGYQIQARVREEAEHFFSLVKNLFRGQPKEVMREVERAEKLVLVIVDQKREGYSSIESLIRAIDKGIRTVVELLCRVYDPGAGAPILVPDTNALIYNPVFADWSYPDVGEFILILTPTVLGELDQLKVLHRVEGVREKTEKIVRQLQEFRRRGSLRDGVPIIKGKSSIRSMATEPNMADSLGWLDSENSDDRILASTIEIIRRNPSSPVALVTRDINLQNKADHARLPTLMPPDPPAGN